MRAHHQRHGGVLSGDVDGDGDDGEMGSGSSGMRALLPSLSSPSPSSAVSLEDGANIVAAERRMPTRLALDIVAGRCRHSPTTAGPTWTIAAAAAVGVGFNVVLI